MPQKVFWEAPREIAFSVITVLLQTAMSSMTKTAVASSIAMTSDYSILKIREDTLTIKYAWVLRQSVIPKTLTTT